MEDIKYQGLNLSAMQRNMTKMQNIIKKQSEINKTLTNEVYKLKQSHPTNDMYTDLVDDITKKVKGSA